MKIYSIQAIYFFVFMISSTHSHRRAMLWLKKIFQSHFMQQNTVFFLSSILINFLNFLYQIFLSRFLTLQQFGELQLILSLLMFYSVLINTVGLVVTNIAGKEKQESTNQLIRRLSQLIFFISCLGGILIIVFSKSLQQLFHFSSLWPFIMLGCIFPFTVMCGMYQSYLQGNLQFKKSAQASFVLSGAKIILAFIFVYMGFKTAGAVLGILLSQVFALLYLFTSTNFTFSWFSLPSWDEHLKKECLYAGVMLFIASTLVFLSTGDILLAKYFFPPEQVGEYSAVSVLARIVLYLCTPITMVFFSFLNTAAEKEKVSLLKRTLLLILAVSVGTGVCLMVFKQYIIQLLFGSAYLPFVSLVFPVLILMSCLSFLQVLLYYFLALRVFLIYKGALVTLGIVLLLNIFFHATLESIIYNFLGGTLFLIAWLGGVFYHHHKNKVITS